MTLWDKLKELSESDIMPLHMPGHKRMSGSGRLAEIYGMDITEIDGFDDLHNPTGIIKDMERQAARIYGADCAWLSVNGSTAANEAAILSVCAKGDEIIMGRGSHKSVYYAAETGDLKPVYLECRYAEGTELQAPVSADQIREAFAAHPGCRCAVITSPTYEGLTADIEAISRIVHENGAVLIVDSAHGAHFGMSGAVPENAIAQGADLVIVSLHKTLPSPTQTALLLAAREVVSYDRIQHYMSVFQSSSPSYVLMAGIGECLDYMESRAAADIDRTAGLAEELKKHIDSLDFLDAGGTALTEPFKAVVRSKSPMLSGKELYDELLHRYHIQCEMYAENYVLAMFGPLDDERVFERLKAALDDIDGRLRNLTRTAEAAESEMPVFPKPERACGMSAAINSRREYIPADTGAVGRIAADYCMAYPPGIPIVVPGEIIDRDVVEYIKKGLEKELNLVGLKEGRIPVME